MAEIQLSWPRAKKRKPKIKTLTTSSIVNLARNFLYKPLKRQVLRKTRSSIEKQRGLGSYYPFCELLSKPI